MARYNKKRRTSGQNDKILLYSFLYKVREKEDIKICIIFIYIKIKLMEKFI